MYLAKNVMDSILTCDIARLTFKCADGVFHCLTGITEGNFITLLTGELHSVKMSNSLKYSDDAL